MTWKSLRIRDFMNNDPVTVRAEDELMQVLHLLIEHDVSGVPVLDGAGNLVGILTERDCIRTALQAGYHDEHGGPVARFMTSAVHTLHPDDSLMDAAELFASSPFRRCPVLRDGRLVGLISRRDVIRALTGHPWFPGP